MDNKWTDLVSRLQSWKDTVILPRWIIDDVKSIVSENVALRNKIEAAQLIASQAQQSAAAIQNDPQKANAVSASWVIEIAGRILSALAASEEQK